MNGEPDISVVMSVYNGVEHLHKTVESILSQRDVALEFIIVNDGSIDESGKILDEYQRRDARVRVIHQENQGLTKALIRGCSEAKGEYIARQDVGDISYPNRLRKELSYIAAYPKAAIVSCGTRFVGPEGEYLYDINQNNLNITNKLITVELSEIRGPSHHGSTIFPKSLYEKVDGYRSSFYFAQDLDLWMRLAEHGDHIVVPEILYEAMFTLNAISSLYRDEQIATARVILECASLRQKCIDESSALEKAKMILPNKDRKRSQLDHAKALYFIGSCLRKRGDSKAGYYFKQAFMTFPLHLKSAMKLLLR